MALKPEWENLVHPVVPEPYVDHELVAGRVFYILPCDLLRPLIDTCGEKAFVSDLLKLEAVLSARLHRNQRLIGYNRSGEGFDHTLLPFRDVPLPNPSDRFLKEIGRTRESYDCFLKEAPKRLGPYRDALRGYLGWLITNRQYLSERDTLFSNWHPEILTIGIPQSGPTITGSIKPNPYTRLVESQRSSDFLSEFEQFYARWRLQHLITRELPEPLAPQIPIAAPAALQTNMRTGCVSLYQPDTVPVASRDMIRDILEEIRTHEDDNNHLKEWHAIVRKSRQNDHTLRKYGQILNLHFYWSRLRERHPNLFKGRVGKIQAAFGNYLGVDSKAIENARRRIKKRLQAPE